MRFYPVSCKEVRKMEDFEPNELEMWMNYKPFNEELAMNENLDDSENSKIFANENNNYFIGKYMYEKNGNIFDNSVNFPKNTRWVRIMKWSLSWVHMKKYNINKTVIYDLCTWGDNGGEYGVFYLGDIMLGYNYEFWLEPSHRKYAVLLEDFFYYRDDLFHHQNNLNTGKLKLSQKQIDAAKRLNNLLTVDLFERVLKCSDIIKQFRFITTMKEKGDIINIWSYKGEKLNEISGSKVGLIFYKSEEIFAILKGRLINQKKSNKVFRDEFEAFRNAIIYGIDKAQDYYRNLNPLVLALEFNRELVTEERNKYLRIKDNKIQ